MLRRPRGESSHRGGLRFPAAACGFLLLSATACTKDQLGLPITPVSAKSPDGRHIAFVRNHPSIDPPSQSLWLSSKGRSARKLRSLGEDVDWCRSVVWSADSSTVAFLVRDARLIVVDAETARIVLEVWLTDPNDEAASDRVASDLVLSDDGREARFRICRRIVEPREGERRLIDCGDFETARIRE